MQINARAVLRSTLALEDVVDVLAEHAAAASPLGAGRVEVVITVPADSLRQAAVTSLALLEQAGQVESVELVPTDLFDARQGLTSVPELLSVTQVAEYLGVSRQAVLQRLEHGSLTGRKVGSAWAVPAAAVRAIGGRARS